MATKIRLSRYGRKKKPFYRIVVADSRAPRDGRHVEKIGYYDPLTEPSTLQVNRDRALDWLNKGAEPSLSVRNLFSGEGIMLEWDLRRKGSSDEAVQEELQKFNLLREQKEKDAETLKQKRAEEKQKAEKEAAKAAEEAEAEEQPEAEAASAETAESAEESGDESTDESADSSEQKPEEDSEKSEEKPE